MIVLLILELTLILTTAAPIPPAFSNDYSRSWKSYHNEKFAFSIKYPATWQADHHEGEGNPIVIILPQNPKPHEFYITISIEDRTFAQVREGFAEFTRKSPASRFDEREILFANRRAYRITRTDNPGFYTVYIPFSGKLYVVAAARFDISDVRKALRTFRFD